jgi:hypothetical protein
MKLIYKTSKHIATNTPTYIKEILATEVEQEEEVSIEEKILINERMKMYLNTVPIIKDIDGSVFEVTFSLGDITLRGTYDVASHTISRVYYVIPSTEETLLIRDLDLPLNEVERENLAYLSNNPKVYLRLFNVAAFDKYERMLKGE